MAATTVPMVSGKLISLSEQRRSAPNSQIFKFKSDNRSVISRNGEFVEVAFNQRKDPLSSQKSLNVSTRLNSLEDSRLSNKQFEHLKVGDPTNKALFESGVLSRIILQAVEEGKLQGFTNDSLNQVLDGSSGKIHTKY